MLRGGEGSELKGDTEGWIVCWYGHGDRMCPLTLCIRHLSKGHYSVAESFEIPSRSKLPVLGLSQRSCGPLSQKGLDLGLPAESSVMSQGCRTGVSTYNGVSIDSNNKIKPWLQRQLGVFVAEDLEPEGVVAWPIARLLCGLAVQMADKAIEYAEHLVGR